MTTQTQVDPSIPLVDETMTVRELLDLLPYAGSGGDQEEHDTKVRTVLLKILGYAGGFYAADGSGNEEAIYIAWHIIECDQIDEDTAKAVLEEMSALALYMTCSKEVCGRLSPETRKRLWQIRGEPDPTGSALIAT